MINGKMERVKDVKKLNENDLEIVAEFKEENNNFLIRQPIAETSLEDQKRFHLALAKAAFKNKK
jgi:hypothetical protein